MNTEFLDGMKRSHMCEELSLQDETKEVILCGWVAKRRDHGGLIFIDLRDRSGIVQVVFSPEINDVSFKKAEDVRSEYVLAVRGKVAKRSLETINANIATGEVEILGEELKILNDANTPPFYIQDGVLVDEMVRLKYRYLDLRRPEMQKNMILRHKVTMAMRKYFDENAFLEIETPMLSKSTPEGARDYLVPSRLNAGKFYALPQSPQIYKQLLMVSGLERYFQIVRCFRDEDLRADRQPEFTQLDVEMSFVEREDVLQFMEKMVAKVFLEAAGTEVKLPIQRLSYDEAIARYGSDKPDLRFAMELLDISDAVSGSEFKIYETILKEGGQIKAIKVDGYADAPRRELDDLVKFVGMFGAKGLSWFCFNAEGVKSPIAKFFTDDMIDNVKRVTEAKKGDLVLVVAGDKMTVANALGQLRLEMAKRLNLIDETKNAFVWVLDFPMFDYDAESKRFVAMHHPFTSPCDEDIKLLDDPERFGEIKAKAYDLVMNGTELGGGSIRIYNRLVQEKVFRAIGFSDEEAKEKFGFLLEAFEYGTPPHGGIAFGLDRIVMLLAKCSSIRDVIAFPKTQSAADAMMQAPSLVSEKQLKELHIKTDLVLTKANV